MRNIKSFVENITKPVIRKNGFVTPQIIFDWPLIVGDYLAKYTTPIKITYPAQKNINGILHIEVIGAQAPIIQQLEQEIINKIAAYFGFKAVAKIRLIHSREWKKDDRPDDSYDLSPEEREKLDKMIGEIEDEGLKKKLEAIGQAIYRKKHDNTATTRQQKDSK